MSNDEYQQQQFFMMNKQEQIAFTNSLGLIYDPKTDIWSNKDYKMTIAFINSAIIITVL